MTTSQATKNVNRRSPASGGSADYVRIFPAEGKPATHLLRHGMDYTICGYDTSGDDMVHRKPPVELHGHRRVTCSDCIAIIGIVRDHLNPPNAELCDRAVENPKI